MISPIADSSVRQRRAGVPAHMLKGNPGRSSDSVSSLSSITAAATFVAAVISVRARSARGQAVSLELKSSGLHVRSQILYYLDVQ